MSWENWGAGSRLEIQQRHLVSVGRRLLLFVADFAKLERMIRKYKVYKENEDKIVWHGEGINTNFAQNE